jgi:hypothetical protein
MRLQTGTNNRSTTEDLYQFGPGLVASIRGDRRAQAHFRAEYAAALAPDSGLPALEVTIGAGVLRGRNGRTTDAEELRGAHKLARWRASVPARLDGNAVRVAVDVRGPLGLTLVQSYIVEPLLSLAAVRAGLALLPSAAIALNGKALLLIGRSRSGKSSLAARALAAGLPVLGDDQVLISTGQECLPFPRRLRVYPDLMRTAPTAFAALRPSARGALAALGHVNALTRGFVAPPLRVKASTLGAGAAPTPLPIGEVVVIRRAPVDELRTEHLEQGELTAEIEDALSGQRSEIFSLPGIQAATATLLAEERSIIASALAAAPARRVWVPTSWQAEQAVGRLAQGVGLER